MSTYPLPSREELIELALDLAVASDWLRPAPLRHEPRSARTVMPVLAEDLSEAMSNVDEELEGLDEFSRLDRVYFERQIERCHRDRHLGKPPLRFREADSRVPFAPRSVVAEGTRFIVWLLEVPLLSIDKSRAILRGQRAEPAGAEDFEIRLHARGDAWVPYRST